MNITKISKFSGKKHTMDLPITQEHIEDYMSGTLAQHAFPHLTAEQREFIISGTTPEEWDIMFPKCSECKRNNDDHSEHCSKF